MRQRAYALNMLAQAYAHGISVFQHLPAVLDMWLHRRVSIQFTRTETLYVLLDPPAQTVPKRQHISCANLIVERIRLIGEIERLGQGSLVEKVL